MAQAMFTVYRNVLSNVITFFSVFVCFPLMDMPSDISFAKFCENIFLGQMLEHIGFILIVEYMCTKFASTLYARILVHVIKHVNIELLPLTALFAPYNHCVLTKLVNINPMYMHL